jgi:hypothetical protein
VAPVRFALAQPAPSNELTGGYLYNARVAGGGGVGVLWSVDRAEAIAARAAAERPAVVVLDSLWLDARGDGAARLVADVRAAAPGVRVAWLVHGLPSMFARGASAPDAAERAAIAAADALILPGPWLAGALAHPRTFVCEPGVDPAFRAAAVAAAAAARATAGPPTVITVATVTRAKGHDALHAALVAAGAPCRWIVVGDLATDPPFVAELRARDGLRPEMLGAVAHAELPAHLAAADLFALASRAENSPLALREALAAGLPVVATAVGGVPAIVRDGADGLLVPPADPAALAAALARVLSDAALRARLAAAARARAFPDWPAAAGAFAAAAAELAR